MRRALIVDDDRPTRRVLQILFERLGLECVAFEGAEPALALLREESVSLVLTDLRMPRMNGIEFMRALRQLDEEVPVIVLTAYGTVESAVEAMKLGAVDFLAKPFDVDALELLIQRSLESRRARVENRYWRQQAEPSPALEDLVGDSAGMREIFALIRKVAPTKSAALVTGETGTGKELVARAIHRLSPRREHLFVALNCSAIPAELLESELFGHVRGAFSGAQAERIGRIPAADGGTLFLDEIGDMDPKLQAKLLRVLEEGVVEPVGSNRRTPVDVRIVSSTNRDLEAAIADGSFREDLFYRLNVFRFELPPLRERREDVPALAATFLARFGAELRKGEIALSQGAAERLARHDWPGNVRELRNLMERAAVLVEGGCIEEDAIEALLPSQRTDPERDDAPDARASYALEDAVGAAERKALLRALAAARDDKLRAAQLLGIGERTLWTKLKKHGL